MTPIMKTALTIAGSDSIGGAGIQTDIKAMASLGVHAATVITAVTAQNTFEVREVFPIPEDIIQAQLDAVLKDCNIGAVKTGMLYSEKTVKVVADTLEDHDVPLVIDPVMIATVGDSLSTEGLSKALKKYLLPMCELVTPNRHEAEVLSGMKIRNEDDAMLACELIGKEGSSVLLKGGHMDTKNIIDYLYLSSEFTIMRNPRLNKAGHGSGCTLSSYITANLSKGLDLVNSVLKSRELIQKAISTQYAIGKGEVVVNSMVYDNSDAVKFGVLDALDTASAKLIEMLPHRLVPKNGVNIAFAIPDAAGPEDVAGIDGGLNIHNGLIVKNGEAKFGAADHLSYIVLEAMNSNPAMRSVANISSTGFILDIMEEVGLSVIRSERRGSDWKMTTKNVIDGNKGVPDVIYDTDQKNGTTLKVLGRTPKDVLSKIESVLE